MTIRCSENPGHKTQVLFIEWNDFINASSQGLLEQFNIEKDQQPVPQDIKPPLSHEPNQNEARNEEIRQDERSV